MNEIVDKKRLAKNTIYLYIRNLVVMLHSQHNNDKMTGAWLLANDLKQISDCTGGRAAMQFDTANWNQ